MLPVLRHIARPARLTLLVVLVSTALSAAAFAGAFGTGGGAGTFAAELEARAVADPTVTSCPELPAVQKVEGRYEGTFEVEGEERPLGLRLSLETLVARGTGVGSAKGRWQFFNFTTREVVGRGELLAAGVGDPSAPGLELQGLLLGTVQGDPPTESDPPTEADPPGERPELRLIGSFVASLGEGATFPHLKGTVGDPTGLESNPAVLLPAVKC